MFSTASTLVFSPFVSTRDRLNLDNVFTFNRQICQNKLIAQKFLQQLLWEEIVEQLAAFMSSVQLINYLLLKSFTSSSVIMSQCKEFKLGYTLLLFKYLLRVFSVLQMKILVSNYIYNQLLQVDSVGEIIISQIELHMSSFLDDELREFTFIAFMG